MNQDLKYLAETVSEWGSVLGLSHIVKSGAKVEYVAGKCVDPDLIYRQRGHRVSRAFTRAEWQAARDELLAPEIGIVESFLGSPFTTPDEDEEWERIQQKQESSGGDNDYWIAQVKSPKRLEPYSAECEDLIELFQMTFQEGEAFKALWRKGQMRIGNGKPGDTLLRNSEKVYHFGGRMVAMEVGR